MNYAQKLKDPRWQRLRLKAMERDGFKCMCCGATDKTLNVNHLEYVGEPWECDLDKLETLCEPCHRRRRKLEIKMRAEDTFIFLGYESAHRKLVDYDIFMWTVGGLICEMVERRNCVKLSYNAKTKRVESSGKLPIDDAAIVFAVSPAIIRHLERKAMR
jgi:hypothetical protein